MLSFHPYIKVTRKIDGHKMVFERTNHFLIIYQDKIMTAAENFPLNEVHDISFKPLSSGEGFLYLHTSSGLKAYITETNPVYFIKSYYALKSSN